MSGANFSFISVNDCVSEEGAKVLLDVCGNDGLDDVNVVYSKNNKGLAHYVVHEFIDVYFNLDDDEKANEFLENEEIAEYISELLKVNDITSDYFKALTDLSYYIVPFFKASNKKEVIKFIDLLNKWMEKLCFESKVLYFDNPEKAYAYVLEKYGFVIDSDNIKEYDDHIM